MNLSKAIGDDLASYVVILVAGIIGFIGFIKIHNLDAEKIFPFWWRNYISFAKPLIYKTDKEIAAEKEAKRNKHKKKAVSSVADAETINTNTGASTMTKAELKNQQRLLKQQEKEKKKKEKIEAQRIIKEEKEHKKQLKAKRKAQRELEEAKRMFGVIEEPSHYSSSGLNEEDLAVLKELAQAFGKEKKNATKEK